MKIFVPEDLKIDWKDNIEKIVNTPSLKPFNQIVLDFINRLSKKILIDNNVRQYPEVMALGYWFRKGNIINIREKCLQETDHYLLPRGTVLHFCPANVDTIFIYSWLISLLIGNNNIIRITNKLSVQIDFIISIINNLLSDAMFTAIKDRTVILTYEYNDVITQFLSDHCDARVIWGNNETIRYLRAIPLRPSAKEIIFSERYSHAVFCAKAVAILDESGLIQLVNNFYNDAFWFYQNACSSPRSIVWVGDSVDVTHAKEKFWKKLLEKFTSIGSDNETQHQLKLKRLAAVFHHAALEKIEVLEEQYASPFIRVNVESSNTNTHHLFSGGGLFVERKILKLADLTNFLCEQDQTIGVYGFQKLDLIELINRIHNRTIDRIVPIGSMINFDYIWDGYNLFYEFGRMIALRC